MKAISVKNFKKSYRSEFWLKKIPAIEDLSFEVEQSTVTGFLGANDAGKSTTIKSILGLLIPDAGEIRFFGDKELSPETRSRIGFLPERPFFYEYLSGKEFLEFYAQLSGMKLGKKLNLRIEELLELVGLSHAGEKKLREYSKGMLQRVGIAQAIIHDPELIIFDEPMSGLDPDGRYDVGQILQQIAEQGKTVFFSSHLLDDVERISKNLVVLKKGSLIYQGSLAELLGNVDSDYRIEYTDSTELFSEEVKDQESLQKRLDEIRQKKMAIVRIQPVKANLEQAYVNLNEK